MALIKCPECGKEVSDKADACIHCGCPIKKNAQSELVREINFQPPISVCQRCRKKISTHMETCPHCGNDILPEWFDQNNICKINGVEYDLTPFMSKLTDKKISGADRIEYLNELKQLTGCALCGSLPAAITRNGGKLPKEFNGATMEEMRKQAQEKERRRIHCKYCGSTNVEKLGYWSGGWKATYGGLQWHCNNCDSDF